MYRVQQFAKMANVTVRTLHHYDRIGLLSPRLRSESGYRLYRNEDMAQLERIFVLRYLGLTLKQIAELLGRNSHCPEEILAETLHTQAAILRERRDGMTRVLHAVEHAQRQLRGGTAPDWSLYQSILKEIHMQEQHNWTQKYFPPEAQDKLHARQQDFTLEMQREYSLAWEKLLADVEQAIIDRVALTSAEARAMADRWVALIGQFTGGDPQVREGLMKLYDDQQNWPPERQEAHAVRKDLMEWIRAVQKLRVEPES